MYKQKGESGLIVYVLHFVYVYSEYATTSIFHFPERCGDPSVYLFHHARTLISWPLIWYYLTALYLFIWVVTEQGPHQGHWALCCLWVRVMFITSIRVNLSIRPCQYFRVCTPLARRSIVLRGLHIRLRIEIMVWDGRRHLCAVHVANDMQYVVHDSIVAMCAVLKFNFFRTCCFEILYGQLWNVLHFYVPNGSRFFKCNKNRCFFWSFYH